MNRPEIEPGPPQNVDTAEKRELVIGTETDVSLVDPSVFIAPGAVVVGEVRIAAEASIWYGAVMRGDAERIEIGPRTNVQDQCVLHGDPGMPCILGADVTVGHSAVVHGATVEDEALIGIGAIVLNGARIGRGAIVAAGALVTEGSEIPAGMLAVGSPAKPIKPVAEALAKRCRDNTQHYVRMAAKYKAKYDAK
ncbi:gamma carbonic anhydrase family protein [Aporhodopirellula aestuarii]|uniref:Gamma carbonic anhydrase family protein n=1 Tax=Aporhodopirellula aestuarii TaxID=2950107 RepID=A0ABT0TY42_9BACT|nr:gamma carbonic anhydrase family protein [Aporhodopirellula aestuarii]MCM2369511.1 gamma carbonic anhydrase family protein [Aporhodopirellula aestuarii]